MAEKITQKLNKLETLVTELAASSSDLDKAFDLYKKGLTLAKDCYQSLEKIDLEVKELVETDSGDKLEDFQ